MDATKISTWKPVPQPLLMVFGLNLYNDLTGEAKHLIVDPMRRYYGDTDAKTAPFVVDVLTLKRVIGEKDIRAAAKNLELKGRTDAVERGARWLVGVKLISQELADRTDPEEAELAQVGKMLQELTDEADDTMSFSEILRLMPAVTEIVARNVPTLTGNGFTPDDIAAGTLLLDELTRDNGGSNAGLIFSKDATVNLDELTERLIAFFMMWAKRRAYLEHRLGRVQPGFDMSLIAQWMATRPSAIAAREQAKPQATTTAADPGGVIGDALAAFRAGKTSGGAT